jgi:hypothetical protein
MADISCGKPALTLPPVPDSQLIPSLGHFIQNLLRDPPPTMILDMGLGSREQSPPAYDPEPMRVVASKQARTAVPAHRDGSPIETSPDRAPSC